MSWQMPHTSGSNAPPKVPIPRIQARRYQQPRRNIPPNKDRVLVACTNCRERKVRCDGGQPICGNCQDLERPCVYLESRNNRFKAVTKQNQDMIELLKQLRDSVADRKRQQIDDILEHVMDDPKNAAGTSGMRSSPDLDDTDGEAGISAEVGSNGETDILDEDVLEDKESQATGYVGKSSEVQWLRRLRQESEERGQEASSTTPSSPYGPPGDSFENAKQRLEAFRERQQHKPRIPISTSTFYLDGEGVEVEYNVDPYALPTIEVAQRLLDRYMSTVQDMFPVLAKQVFTDQVRHYFTSATQGRPLRVPEKWLAILNLVFAIGAKFSHLTEADWQADSRDHIIYQSRAHMLNLDEPSLVHQPDLMRVQITALFAFYASTVGNVNRAWVAIGIALRYALALGLHLRNEDQAVKIVKKEILVQTWWALQILEGSLSIMLGRPSLVIEDYYSTPLPLPVSIEQLPDEDTASYWNDRRRGGKIYDDNAAGYGPPSSEPCNAGTLLRCLANISKIGQNAMTGLYSTRLNTKSWKEIQGAIAGLCDKLEMWAAHLVPALNFTQPNNGGGFMRERLIIQMSYIRLKILITRPCLCRLDSRIPKQTKASNDFNNEMARKCVNAAKTLTDILPDHATAAYLYQIGPWWSMTHHIMQALTVLLLELSYDTVDASEREDILPKVKKLIKWLSTLKKKDRVAERAYNLAFGVLQSTASRLNLDICDLLQEEAPPSERPESQGSSAVGIHDQSQQSFTDNFGYDSGMSYQSMFAFQPYTYPGDMQVPEMTGSAINLPLGAGAYGPAFDDAFSTSHDEQNPLFTQF